MSDAPEVETIEGRQAFAEGALTIASGARLRLAILTQRLDRAVYGHPAFVEAIKQLALSSSRVEIRVLARDPASTVRESSALIELMRRLSDRCALHQPARPEVAKFEMDLIIADERSYVQRQRLDARIAELAVEVPLKARAQLKAFDELWQDSEPSTEMRALKL